MTSYARACPNLAGRARILAICLIVCGFIRLIIALWHTTFSTSAMLPC
jgi:hypothetical protein